MSENYEFALVLINRKTKQAYRWYELRFQIERECPEVVKLIDEKAICKLIHLVMPNTIYNQDYANSIEKIVDNIITDDETIIVKDYGEARFILNLIKYIDPYNKMCKKHLTNG